MTKVNTKRKLKASCLSRKKRKVEFSNVDDLPWKVVSRSKEADVDGDDGILELEEVDNVEVVYEETDGGRMIKFNNIEEEKGESADSSSEDSADVEDENMDLLLVKDTSSSPPEPFDTANLLPNWLPYPLHPQLLRAVHALNFASPTPIQSRAIPPALAGRDVIGVAETGSGKTLAYGLPILHYLLSLNRLGLSKKKSKRKLCALILCPTRELALQVSSHLNNCVNHFGSAEAQEHSPGHGEPSHAKVPPLVTVVAIVGGMSAQKQRRILNRGVDVLVATPGRLWDILEEDNILAKEIKHVKFLVLDEADRMVQAGHFAELDNILRLTLKSSQQDDTDPDFHRASEGGPEQENKDVIKDDLQTFVFSATMSKDLQRNLKRRSRSKPNTAKFDKKPASTLDDLLLRLDFRDSEPELIDLSPERGVVSSLKEGKIECLSADKDVYLYYFLLRYPGRSLVFLSAIDGIRRLVPLMELLNMKTFPLHSQLEQRQRLKNLDRFKSTPNAVLLATDIAARGLDISAVDHVIHYQIPRSTDIYVHRNGRTARAMRKGFSMLMCAPDERRIVRALLGNLKREENDIPEVSIDLYLLDKLKARVQLARQIDTSHHKVRKEKHDRNWIKKAAEDMEIELDSDFASGSDQETRPSKAKGNAKIAGLKAQLRQLLAQPLIAKGVSAKYITSGSRPIVDDMLAIDHHETMLGVTKVEAGSDLVSKKQKKVPVKKPRELSEEWHGFDT